ncbi:MAG: hypothetical protein ACAI35_24460 [Candidatus Methylacidiphilales bacterium]
MIMDGGGSSLVNPIGGGLNNQLGTQIQNDSLRATVTDMQQKLEEIRRMLSGLRPQTIVAYPLGGDGTQLIQMIVLGAPTGAETIKLPEGASPSVGGGSGSFLEDLWNKIEGFGTEIADFVKQTDFDNFKNGDFATLQGQFTTLNDSFTTLNTSVTTLVTNLGGQRTVTLCTGTTSTETGSIYFRKSGP